MAIVETELRRANLRFRNEPNRKNDGAGNRDSRILLFTEELTVKPRFEWAIQTTCPCATFFQMCVERTKATFRKVQV